MNELYLDVLLVYTGWERRSWFAFMSPHGEPALARPVGSHADGRFVSVRELIAPIFGPTFGTPNVFLGYPSPSKD